MVSAHEPCKITKPVECVAVIMRLKRQAVDPAIAQR